MDRFLQLVTPFLSSFSRRMSFFVLFTFYTVLAFSQNFPVQVIPQAIPPAPIYVSDYADASTISSPLRVQIILNDFEIANREIRLKTYFTGSGLNFQSNDIVVGASPLFLEGGVPLVLTNAELAPYFEFNNISGISPNQYGNAIPEGAYQFCVEVYDVLTGSRLSNKSCAVSVVFQNEPPFLVLPRNKTNVDEVNPQYIVFQWTPRSINVSNVEYELSLVEIWDTQVDPQQAFLSSPPVFQTTTAATTYVYGPADPQLLSGKNYAWRIQAKAKQGTEEIGLFKNQGYSEIFSFSYATACELPAVVNHEVKGSTNANIVWDDFSTEIPEYTVRYRQKGNDNEWFESKTAGNLVTIWDLKPGTIYEYQLSKSCGITQSEWSLEKQFTTFIADDEDSVYDCNISPDFDISNQELLPNMGVGDKFTAGDFPITVLEVNGSNGRFNGKGYVTIPYLSSIKVGVQFTNIAINTEKQLFEGEVITIYDPTLSNILDIDDAIDTVNDVVDSVGEFFEGDNDLDEIQVDWTIGSKDEITIEDGMVVITNPYNGVTKKEPLGDDMIITDQEGNTYYVDPDGNITEGGQITPGEEVNPGNVSGVSNNGDLQSLTAENIIVKFNTKGTYGFDKMPEAASSKLKSEYQTIKDVDGNNYILTHHAVKNGGTTQLQATIEIQNNAYTPDQVVFKNKQGKIFTPTSINGNTATISLDGVYSFENETIYAVVPSKEDANQQLTAGAFTLWHLAEKTIDVAIVSVGASVGDVATAVNGIFGNGLAKINFKNTISVDVNAARTVLGSNGMEVGESPFTAAYNDEQKALRTLAKSAGANDSDTYYLIVLGNEFSNTKGIAGFMPLQRQFGFVFQQYAGSGEEAKGDIAKTVAHEIGHGVFALQHPFAQYGSEMKNKTDWLMDYNEGSGLPHTHWAQIHDPALKFYVFQKEEDGEIGSKIWFTPDWKAFSISSNFSNSIIGGSSPQNVKGTIPGFRFNNIIYEAEFESNGTFKGYYSENSTTPFDIKKYEKQPNETDDVYLFQYLSGNCNAIYKSNFKYVDDTQSQLQFIESNGNITRVFISTCDDNITGSSPYFSSNRPDKATFIYALGTDDEIKDRLAAAEAYAISTINDNIDNVRYSYDDNNSSFILGDLKTTIENNFLSLTDGYIFLDKKLYKRLEHRLEYLSESTNRDVEIFVVFQKVDVIPNNGDWNAYAKKVYENSDLKNRNAIVITMPYVVDTPKKSVFFWPGAYGKAKVDYNKIPSNLKSELSSVVKGKGDIDKFLYGVYTHTYKPQKIHYGLLHADGSITKPIDDKMRSNEYVAGNNFIKKIILRKKPEFDLIRALKKPVPYTTTEDPDYASDPTNPNFEKEWLLYEIEVGKLLDQSKTNSNWDKVENTILFKEAYLDEDVDYYITKYAFKQSFIQWTNDVYNIYGENYTFSNTYNKDSWSSVDPIVAGVADGLSIVLSPIGLDVIGDGIGLIYFSARGDAVNAALYSVAVLIPVISSGELKLAKAALNNGILFYKGAIYSIKTGQTSVRLITANSYKYGKILSFFDVVDTSISPIQLDNFINRLKADEISQTQIKNLLGESNQTKRAEEFIKIADGTPNFDNLIASINDIAGVNATKLNNLIANISELTDGAKGALLNKIKALDGDASKFIDDFADKRDELGVIANKSELVDGWQRLIDSPDGIRLNVNLLEDVSNWPANWKINAGSVNGTIEVFDNSGVPLARIFPDRVVASGRSVIGQPGNKILNRVPPIKNMTYEVDGINYVTDNLGRVTKTTGDLDDAVRVRLGNQQIRAVDVKDGVRGTDQGGHIIGARFFGAGEQINYYPQTSNLNQGAWKTMEDLWAREMVAGKDVKVEVRAIFEGQSSRPIGFEVDWWIDGKKFNLPFENPM